MNIFFLHNDPVLAAQFLVDVHVGSHNCGGKMIIESAQMLANCYNADQLGHFSCPRTQSGNVRSYSYFNHPCSVWVRQSLSNFNWLVSHAQEMVKEKQYRGGNLHFSSLFIDWCSITRPNLPDIGPTTPALAMKNFESLKDEGDPVGSYQMFYVVDKRFDKNGKPMDIYTKRNRPQFWNEFSYLKDM